MISNSVIISRLVIASVLGGLIGLERETSNRPAGFRTHILVSIGSALIMLVSVDCFKDGADPARIAAQVVSGIGFLGAGTILRTGNNIEGLTTAASLWVCAGIGLSIGNGYYLGGVTTTIIVLFFLKSSKRFEKFILKSRFREFKIIAHSRPGLIGDIGILFGKYDIYIKDVSILTIEEEEEYNEKIKEEIKFTIKPPNNINLDDLINDVYLVDGVLEIGLCNRETKN
ncbi:MAG: MgtC/SapB family protein [Tissierellaceae bacterium]